MKPLYLIIALFFSYCMKSPSQLTDNYRPDCTAPSIPQNYPKDSTECSAILEIYDYEFNLVTSSESNDIFAPVNFDPHHIGPINIYWNGLDKEGRAVDPGKYIAKVSIYTIYDTACKCSEVYVK